MNRQKGKSPQEKLAEYTDSLLAGGKLDVPQPAASGKEEMRLRAMVDLLDKGRPGQEIDTQMQSRIRSTLNTLWRTAGPKTARENGPWRSIGQKRRFYAFGLAAAAILILAVAFLAAPGTVTGMPATAQTPEVGIAITFIVVLIALGIIFWWSQRKRK